MNKKQILGIAGSLTLIIGAFTPLVTLPPARTINYFANGEGDGIIIIALAILSLILALKEKYKYLWITGVASLALLGFTFSNFKSGISEIQSSAANIDGLAGDVASMVAKSVTLEWGWGVLAVGVLLLFSSAALKDPNSEEGDSNGSSIADFIEKIDSGKAPKVIAALIVCVIGGFFFLKPSKAPSKPPILPPQSSSPALSQSKKWEFKTEKSPIDDSITYILSLDAEDPTGDDCRLYIRHKEGRLEVYVAFDTSLGYENILVTTRLGSSPATDQEWNLSTSGQSMFYPGDAAEFVRQLISNDRLVIRLTPPLESPLTATFDLSGLPDAIAPIKRLVR